MCVQFEFDVLTPHVLSEWMVEVCGAYLCGVRFMFRAAGGLLVFELFEHLTLGVLSYT
jgi:hypothetical protein